MWASVGQYMHLQEPAEPEGRWSVWEGWRRWSRLVKPTDSAPGFGWPLAEHSVERQGDSGLAEESSAELQLQEQESDHKRSERQEVALK